jgi:hypothetical protein
MATLNIIIHTDKSVVEYHYRNGETIIPLDKHTETLANILVRKAAELICEPMGEKNGKEREFIADIVRDLNINEITIQKT